MGSWISAAVGLIAIIAFLGTVTTFFLRGKQNVRIEKLETDNADLRNDVSDRDKRIVFLESENTDKTTTIKALTSQVGALEKLKIGEAYFQAIEEQINARSAHIIGDQEKLMNELTVIRNQNRDILALLADQRRPT